MDATQLVDDFNGVFGCHRIRTIFLELEVNKNDLGQLAAGNGVVGSEALDVQLTLAELIKQRLNLLQLAHLRRFEVVVEQVPSAPKLFSAAV